MLIHCASSLAILFHKVTLPVDIHMLLIVVLILKIKKRKCMDVKKKSLQTHAKVSVFVMH